MIYNKTCGSLYFDTDLLKSRKEQKTYRRAEICQTKAIWHSDVKPLPRSRNAVVRRWCLRTHADLNRPAREDCVRTNKQRCINKLFSFLPNGPATDGGHTWGGVWIWQLTQTQDFSQKPRSITLLKNCLLWINEGFAMSVLNTYVINLSWNDFQE